MTQQFTGSKTGKTLWEAVAQASTTTKLYWLLRIGVAIEYLGHGWAGLSRSRAWLPYYDLFGISADFALDHLMYITGTVDVTIGLLILIWPARILLLHTTVWGVFTALLRPTVGEGWWEFLERGGNYGMPLALLIMAGWGGWSLRRWLQRVDRPAAISDRTLIAIHWAMRGGLALLLIGHGGFGAFENKPYWYDFFNFFGALEVTGLSGVHRARGRISQDVGPGQGVGGAGRGAFGLRSAACGRSSPDCPSRPVGRRSSPHRWGLYRGQAFPFPAVVACRCRC